MSGGEGSERERLNRRAISREKYLKHTALKPHIKVTTEIRMHRMQPETFPPIHISPRYQGTGS